VARSSTTRYAVLGVLSIGPMSGYEIRKLVSESIGHFWGESYGQIYPTLRRLSEEGLAVVEREEGGKKVYAVTEAGLGELRAWAEGPLEERPLRNELLLRLFFGRHVPKRRLIGLVEEARERQVRALRWYREAEDAPSEDREHPDFPYWTTTLRFGLVMGEAFVRWCDETLQELRALERAEAGEG
jgi:PadR family transcriptional regulator, regulatory protein AphA